MRRRALYAASASRLARAPHRLCPSFAFRTVVTTSPYDREVAPPSATIEARRKVLVYRSHQRGWLELDLIMGSWADRHLPSLTEPELAEYEDIVARENPDLMKWLVEKADAPHDLQQSKIFQRLLRYTHSNDKTFLQRSGNQ